MIYYGIWRRETRKFFQVLLWPKKEAKRIGKLYILLVWLVFSFSYLLLILFSPPTQEFWCRAEKRELLTNGAETKFLFHQQEFFRSRFKSPKFNLFRQIVMRIRESAAFIKNYWKFCKVKNFDLKIIRREFLKNFSYLIICRRSMCGH